MGDVEERVYVCDAGDKGKLKKIIESDPYAPMSFARKSPQMKEIDDKVYLYIKAETEFFVSAEERLKELPSIKRAEKAEEQRILEIIHKEEEEAAGGFGNIFG
ncbi:MAG: hypothetical protein QW112_03280 [Candidatus Micrarchaeia archaeon]